jgi:ribosome-associated protein
MVLVITPEIRIPISEFELSYARSSGPGGQNVNKVNSKAVLRWSLVKSASLRPEIRARLLARPSNQLTSEGELVVSSDRFRDQFRNREDCIEKFKSMIAAAAVVPKHRKKTKPSYSSQRRVQEAKTRHSKKKSFRRSTRYDD